jgi:hypothetical protein
MYNDQVFQPKTPKPGGRLYFLLIILFLLPFNPFAQANDYMMKSADNEVGMEVSRNDKGVDIALFFSRASQFEYVAIEKSGDAQNNFSQCKYIKFNESANDSVVIVKRDTYPYSSTEDVFYRLKTITKDGVSRIYPSVRLPGIKEAKPR